MWPNLSKVKIYIRPGKTDMRKQINGLSMLVEESLLQNVFSGNLFLFCSRSRKQIKVVYWDRTGFCLWQKKLEKDRFPWPETAEAAREITGEELSLLLRGINFFRAHKELKYQSLT